MNDLEKLKYAIEAILNVCLECKKGNDNLFIQGQIHAYESILRLINKTEIVGKTDKLKK